MSSEKLIKHFMSKLGKDPFVSSTKLLEIGIFGSHPALNKAIKDGCFSSLQISKRRTLIPLEEVEKFLRNSINSSETK